MQKSKLDKFIQKYNLGGNVNSVKWKSNGDSLTTSFVTPDKSLLGSVKVDKFPFEDAEIGVYQTDQLKSLINVLGDDVSLDLTKFGDKAVSLKVKNGPVSVDYDKLFERALEKKIRMFYEALKWDMPVDKANTLERFF